MAFQPAGSTSAGTYPANGLSYNYNDQETPLRIFGKPVIEWSNGLLAAWGRWRYYPFAT